MNAVGDPVGLGLVASLARPGGNITGISPVVPEEWDGKMLQLLREALPRAKRVALFVSDSVLQLAVSGTMRSAAQRLGLDVIPFPVRKPSDAAAVMGASAALVVALNTGYRSPCIAAAGRKTTASGLLLSTISIGTASRRS
jgi:putative ABC transport system substrate-binding protein